MSNMLPTESSGRKEHPMMRGLLDYFPAACAEVARVSKVGNDQHNPGQEMHWARGKSTDHADCLIRHLVERGTNDTDGLPHSAKVAWRALALLQEELEEQRDLPSPRGARDPVSKNPFVNWILSRTADMSEGFDGPNTVRLSRDQFIEVCGCIPPGTAVPAERDESMFVSDKTAAGGTLLHDAGPKTGVMWGSIDPAGADIPMATIRESRAEGVRRAYIAGPMRGYPKYNFPAFLEADEKVRRRGFETLNPAVIEIEQGLDPIKRPEEAEERVSQFTSEDWMEVILRDLGCILTLNPKTDALFVLPGWEKSTGALAEVMLARWMGVQVRHIHTMDPLAGFDQTYLLDTLRKWIHTNSRIV